MPRNLLQLGSRSRPCSRLLRTVPYCRHQGRTGRLLKSTHNKKSVSLYATHLENSEELRCRCKRNRNSTVLYRTNIATPTRYGVAQCCRAGLDSLGD
ncbi:unnamed protein product [Chondrus crispus]|uniref:Uncharacterized protein n=1 Tax=Chondrus crispus TaxID=2769 RepID=R7QNS3_CHOCR|nr:unnamed protein product [Chondrus crispus]CDF39428.1 unnamed protein product [Chondrus crispus]|eukprot:XP_005719339.1 unnamed protein product [Chondrus crispus]